MSGHLHDAVITMLATIAGCGLAWRILAPRALHLPAICLILIGWLGLLSDVAAATLNRHVAVVSVSAVIGVICVIIAAKLLHKKAVLLVCLVAITLPLRVGVPLGGETRNLLLPLYLVLGTWLVIDLWTSISALRRAPDLSALGRDIRSRLFAKQPSDNARRSIGASMLVDIALAAFVLWSCISISWAYSLSVSETDVALFLLPFGVCFVLVRDALRTADASRARMIMTRAAGWFVGVLTVASTAGIYQRFAHVIWQNPKVRVADVFAPDFRTNSIFWDPNIYGRYLVASILLVISALVWRLVPGRKLRIGAGVILCAQIVALWWTYSQSSFVALAIGCFVLALLVTTRRVARYLGVACIVVLVGAGIAASHAGVFHNKGRLDVARGGISLMAQAPVEGVGYGSFDDAYAWYEGLRGNIHLRLRASHATPVTVGAELGVVGLAAYLILLAGAGAAASAGRTDDAANVNRAARRRGFDAAHVRWAGAVFFAVAVHSLLYASFFEDPLTWFCAACLAAPAARSLVKR